MYAVKGAYFILPFHNGVVARIRERTKLPLPQLALRSHLRTADGVGPSSAHHAV